jgi:ubiquinone/menaquinone biosynthesis C-methylase UbiE
VDLSFEMLQKGRTQNTGLVQIQADGVSIPLVDNCSDGIIVECALSLSGKVEEAIGEFRRVLRPGGKLIITDIFIRELKDTSGLDCLTSTHCLAGVMTEESISGILTNNGFFQKFWQDHTKEFKQWMAEMVFNLGSLKALYHLLGFREERGESPFDSLGRNIKLGYYLLVAEKQAETAQ